MQDPSRQEEQRGGPGGPEEQGAAGEEVRAGEAPAQPGLTVWVVMELDPLDPGGEVIGVCSTGARAREFIEERIRSESSPGWMREILWDSAGGYTLSRGRRRPIPYEFERFTVL